MQQPDLGKLIAELRKSKGLTQEELVSKCGITVRTLQRIEAGVVTPRSYTVRMIFVALEYNPDSSKVHSGFTSAGIGLHFERIYTYIIDLFNLKTHKMKKITILSLTACCAVVSLCSLIPSSHAQDSNQSCIKYYDGKDTLYLYTEETLLNDCNYLPQKAYFKLGKDTIYEIDKKDSYNPDFLKNTHEGDTITINGISDTDKLQIEIKRKAKEYSKVPI